MFTDIRIVVGRQFALCLLKTWMPLTVALGLVLWLLYQNGANSLLATTQLGEQQAIDLARQFIATEQVNLRGDVLYLAEQASLRHWLQTALPTDKSRVSTDFLNFSRYRQLYDQVRFIDEKGHEVVRINWNNGQPVEVPTEHLQDKSDRFYVQNSIILEKGDVYISPFDLNIENNQIEQPLKPMIRLATPVFDQQGKKRGVIVLNYLGQRIIDRVLEIGKQNKGFLWLLNAKGYWLLGPDKETEWGFMYPQKESMRFSRQYSEIWAMMEKATLSAQKLNDSGLFTYKKLNLLKKTKEQAADNLILVSYIPTSILNGMKSDIGENLFFVFIILTLLLGVISSIASYHLVRRKQSEASVRDNESRFRGLLESAPDAIVIVDQNGRLNMINAQTEKWFGYSRSELLGQPVEKLLPKRFQIQHVVNRENYIKEPSSRPMSVQGELFAMRKDGSEFPVEISLSPLNIGQSTLVTSIIRDISVRKKVEEEQHQLEVRYQELVNNLPVGVYRNTPGDSGKFIEINDRMVQLFEADSSEDMLRHSVCDLYSNPEDRKSFNDKMFRQGYVDNEEVRLKTLHGREFCASITAVMKENPDKSIYFDGVVEDVTARKESELKIQQLNNRLRSRSKELEAINQELESFSYSVSHDLRAPLRAIDGFSHTLVNNYADVLDAKGVDRLNRVRAGAQRMAELIDDLLTLSRVTRTEIKREQVDLTSISNNVIDELRQGDAQRNVEFSVENNLVAEADASFTRTIMDNLLGNAWKFTGKNGNAKIEVGSKHDANGKTYFVRDNGAGFDMTYANKLFGAFQRLHDASEYPGTGIGLATVKRVINKHGGCIWAESAVGQGATFYFTLEQE
jgi:PAS domain S-box-containing protein